MTTPTFSKTALSPTQTGILNRAGMLEYRDNVAMLGARKPRVIFSSCGLWYGGTVDIGDFSGTEQGGSGGPFALPYSPVGSRTIHFAGRNTKTAADQVSLYSSGQRLDTFNSGTLAGAAFKVAARRMVSSVIEIEGLDWDPTTRTLSNGTWGSAIPWSGADDYTGHELIVFYSDGTLDREALDIAYGFYRLESANSSGEMVLTPDETDETPTLSPNAFTSADGNLKARLFMPQGVSAYVNATWYGDCKVTFQDASPTAGSLTINGVTYTLGGNWTVGSNRATTIDNLVTLLAASAHVEVIEETNSYLVFRSKTTARYNVSSSGEVFVGGSTTAFVSRGELVLPTTAPTLGSEDDTVEIRHTVDGTLRVTHVSVLSTSGSSVWCNPEYDLNDITGTADVGQAGNIERVVYHQVEPFVHRAVTTWANDAEHGSVVTVASSLGWTPNPLDYFVVYYDHDTAPLADLSVESDPEACPTDTAESSLACWWPYWSPTRSAKTSGKSLNGTGTLLASAPGSGMNHYWWGLFEVPEECFLVGDRIEIRNVLDFSYAGQPFFLEVLLIPNFDPEASWEKGAGRFHEERLTRDFSFFWHSPVIRLTQGDVQKQIPTWITLRGKAGAVQTIGVAETGDNYSQQWDCTFQISGGQSSTGGSTRARRFSRFPDAVTRGPQSSIAEVDRGVYWDRAPMRWTLLVKAEHPSNYGIPGIHANYPGQRYCARTSNGGIILSSGVADDYATDTNTAPIPIPLGPRFRCASFDVEWTPGGTH